MKKLALSSVVFAYSLMLCGCSGSTTSVAPGAIPPDPSTGVKRPTDTLGGLPKPSPIDVYLTDAAPRLGSLIPTEIDLGVVEVDAISNGAVIQIAHYGQPQVVNVLAEQDQPGSIGIGTVWSGQYQAIRFVFNTASSQVVAGGNDYPITFPLTSAASTTTTSGASTTTQSAGNGNVAVTVSGNFMEGASAAQAVEADFNAFESLKLSASGNIVARPTLFAVPSDQAGKLAGSIVNRRNGQPVSGATIVAFDANGNVANTDNTDATGAFKMHTLAAGQYHLVVYNSYRTAAGQTVAASGQYVSYYSSSSSSSVDGGYVTVMPGQTTSVPSVND